MYSVTSWELSDSFTPASLTPWMNFPQALERELWKNTVGDRERNAEETSGNRRLKNPGLNGRSARTARNEDTKKRSFIDRKATRILQLPEDHRMTKRDIYISYLHVMDLNRDQEIYQGPGGTSVSAPDVGLNYQVSKNNLPSRDQFTHIVNSRNIYKK